MNDSELLKPQNSLPGVGPVTSSRDERENSDRAATAIVLSDLYSVYEVCARLEGNTRHIAVPGMQTLVIAPARFTAHRGFVSFMCYAGRMATQQCVVRAFVKANPGYERVVSAACKSWFCVAGDHRLNKNPLEALEFEHDAEGVDVYQAFLDFVADNFWNKRTFTRVMRFYSAYKMGGSPATHDHDILVRDEAEQQQELEQHFRRSLTSDARYEIKIYCLETKKLLLSF